MKEALAHSGSAAEPLPLPRRAAAPPRRVQHYFTPEKYITFQSVPVTLHPDEARPRQSPAHSARTRAVCS